MTWTGDTYPETEGWARNSSNPPPRRWLENGKLFIDSRVPWGLWEGYGQSRPGMMTPGVGEMFVMSWTVRVDDVTLGLQDPGVIARSDDQYEVFFVLGVDGIHSAWEPGNWAPFAPGVFHDFRLESDDMRHYELYIDGAPALQGSFFESLFSTPEVGFGDASTGRSLAAWDEVGFGMVTVPEPAGGLSLLAGICLCRSLERFKRRRNGSPSSKEIQHER